MANRGRKDSEDQYPIHRGPFLFSPHFLTVSDWFPEFRLIIERALSSANVTATIDQPYQGRQALIKFSESEMTIDGDGGLFCVDQLGNSESEEDDLSYWVGPCGVPPQFFKELHDDPANVRKLGTDYDAVCRFFDFLYLHMHQRFEKALEYGFAKITARLGTAFDERTELEHWQLERIQLTERESERFLEDDRNLDEGIGQEGIKIFGLSLTPIIRPLGARSAEGGTTGKGRRGRPRSLDHAKLEEIMLDLMRKRGPPSPKNPKWNGELFVKAVQSKMDVGRTTVLEKIPLVIAEYKKSLGNKQFR